ncbi:MAG TPA: hypothetical protein VFS92_01645 [Planctomycetota bacterium]|nr:hypothetical protein [Planctomycetota bacterium]
MRSPIRCLLSSSIAVVLSVALATPLPARVTQDGAPAKREISAPEWKLVVPADWVEIDLNAPPPDHLLVVPTPRAWNTPAPHPNKDLFRIFTLGTLKAASAETVNEHASVVTQMLAIGSKPGGLEFKLEGTRVEDSIHGPVFRCDLALLSEGKLIRRGSGIYIPTVKGTFALEFFGAPDQSRNSAAIVDTVVSSLSLSTRKLHGAGGVLGSRGWIEVISFLVLVGIAALIQKFRDRLAVEHREEQGLQADDPNPAATAEELERTRARHLQMERLIRGWGKALVFIYALIGVIALFGLAKDPARIQSEGAAGPVFGVLATNGALVLVGRLLWTFRPVGQVLITLMALCMVPGLFLIDASPLVIAASVLVVGLPCALCWSPMGRTVFSERYRKQVVPATPHVRPGIQPPAAS